MGFATSLSCLSSSGGRMPQVAISFTASTPLSPCMPLCSPLLRVCDSLSGTGDWILQVQDVREGFEGVLESYALDIYGASSCVAHGSLDWDRNSVPSCGPTLSTVMTCLVMLVYILL